MNNQENQSGAADPFEDSLRQILSNDQAAKSGLLSAPLAGASNSAAGMSPADRRAADDAAVAERIRREQKILFWINLFRPLAIIAVVVLLGWFVLRISSLGG